MLPHAAVGHTGHSPLHFLADALACLAAAAGGAALFGLENGGLFVLLAISLVAALVVGNRWGLLAVPVATAVGGALFFVLFRPNEPLVQGFDIFGWNLFWSLAMAVPSLIGAVVGLWLLPYVRDWFHRRRT